MQIGSVAARRALEQLRSNLRSFEARIALVEQLCTQPLDENGEPVEGWMPPSAEALRSVLEAGHVG